MVKHSAHWSKLLLLTRAIHCWGIQDYQTQLMFPAQSVYQAQFMFLLSRNSCKLFENPPKKHKLYGILKLIEYLFTKARHIHKVIAE